MIWVTIILVLILVQLIGIAAGIRHQTSMIRAASDLNLEAHDRLLDQLRHNELQISRPGHGPF